MMPARLCNPLCAGCQSGSARKCPAGWWRNAAPRRRTTPPWPPFSGCPKRRDPSFPTRHTGGPLRAVGPGLKHWRQSPTLFGTSASVAQRLWIRRAHRRQTPPSAMTRAVCPACSGSCARRSSASIAPERPPRGRLSVPYGSAQAEAQGPTATRAPPEMGFFRWQWHQCIFAGVDRRGRLE